MSGFPIVLKETGGIPVVAVEANAPPATVATNGLGLAVTLVEDNGIPLVIEGLPEPEGE